MFFFLNATIFKREVRIEEMRLIIIISLVIVRKQMIQRNLQRKKIILKAERYSHKGTSRKEDLLPFFMAVMTQNSNEPESIRTELFEKPGIIVPT